MNKFLSSQPLLRMRSIGWLLKNLFIIPYSLQLLSLSLFSSSQFIFNIQTHFSHPISVFSFPNSLFHGYSALFTVLFLQCSFYSALFTVPFLQHPLPYSLLSPGFPHLLPPLHISSLECQILRFVWNMFSAFLASRFSQNISSLECQILRFVWNMFSAFLAWRIT